MKKIISILVLTILFISCNKNENHYENAIVDYFNKNAKDPKSYESVELKVIDTITVEDCAKLIIENNNRNIANNKIEILDKESDISKREREINEFKNNESIIADLNKSIESKKDLLNSLKSLNSDYDNENNALSKFLVNNESVAYLILHRYRLKNGFGALDLVESYFLFDKNNKLLNKSEDILEIYSSANQEFKKNYLK